MKMYILINKTTNNAILGATEHADAAKVSYLALKKLYPNDEIEIHQTPVFTKEKMLTLLIKDIEII